MKSYGLLATVLFAIQMGAMAQVLLKDINPGTAGSSANGFVRMGNHVYFVADDGTHGVELWKTDGTTAGTQMVKDINPNGDALVDNVTGGTYSKLVVLGNHLYFTANDDTHGFELWKSDGTETGTVLVKDVAPGADHGSDMIELAAINNLIFFRGDASGSFDGELWKSDGTEAGTVLVKNINASSGSFPEKFFGYNGNAYFYARTSTEGGEIWKSDGTTAGTVLLKDINPGIGNSIAEGFTIYNGELYFSAYNVANGTELWKTDGTTAGTQMVKDINPGTPSGAPFHFSVFNGKLFFSGVDATNGRQLWSSDGTAIGTSIFKVLNPNGYGSPYAIKEMNGKGYFRATGDGTGSELWVTDGTAAGTNMVIDINNSLNADASPSNLTVAGGKLFFTANDGTNGVELWSTDGTAAGTQQYNLCLGTCSSTPVFLTPALNKLFVSLYTDSFGREPYVINNLPTGIATATSTLQFSIYPNPAHSQLVVAVKADSHIAIIDLQGRQVMAQPSNGPATTVDVSALAQGMYVVKVTAANGETGLKKFVKE